uniref:Uncharacterized protein n=1 Tax=Leersia perrieri TaxID=77586 RepID=A0A0D9VX21_9ORYZ
MEVSARLRPLPASPAPLRGRGSLPPGFASTRPASRAVSAKNIGTPAGLDLEKKNVGKNPPCLSCETKGAVLCATCAGSGLYIDSILESQGIIVKAVEALGTLCVQSAEAVDTYKRLQEARSSA